MYVIGGLSNDEETNDIFEFNMTQLRWSKWPADSVLDMTKRESHACINVDDQFL